MEGPMLTNSLGIRIMKTQKGMFEDWYKQTAFNRTNIQKETFLHCHQPSGRRTFGWHPDRHKFIALWLQYHDMNCALYEVIYEMYPARLYFDIECETDEEISSAWLKKLLDVIDNALRPVVPAEYLTKQIMNACRIKTDKVTHCRTFKISFHVIYPHLVCENNTVVMKKLIQDHVQTSVSKYPEFRTKGDQTVVDGKVYTKNRHMRICYAVKNTPDSKLIPWSLEKWAPITFDDCPEAHIDWLENTFISVKNIPDHEKTFLLTYALLPQSTSDKQSSKPSRKHKLLSITKQNGKRIRTEKADTKQTRRTLLAFLPLLGMRRAVGADDFFDWLYIGWIIRDACTNAAAGEYWFHLFSKRSPKYSQDAVQSVFNTQSTNSNVTIGTLIYYAKSDNPLISAAMLKRINHQPINAFNDWMRTNVYILATFLLLSNEDTRELTDLRNVLEQFCNAETSADFLLSAVRRLSLPSDMHPGVFADATNPLHMWCVTAHHLLYKSNRTTYGLLNLIIYDTLKIQNKKKKASSKQDIRLLIVLLPLIPASEVSATASLINHIHSDSMGHRLCKLMLDRIDQKHEIVENTNTAISADNLVQHVISITQTVYPRITATIIQMARCCPAEFRKWIQKTAVIFITGILLHFPSYTPSVECFLRPAHVVLGGNENTADILPFLLNRCDTDFQYIPARSSTDVDILMNWSMIIHVAHKLSDQMTNELFQYCIPF